MDGFCSKLDKAFTKFVKKYSHMLPKGGVAGGNPLGGAIGGAALDEGEESDDEDEDTEPISAMTKDLQLSN